MCVCVGVCVRVTHPVYLQVRLKLPSSKIVLFALAGKTVMSVCVLVAVCERDSVCENRA